MQWKPQISGRQLSLYVLLILSTAIFLYLYYRSNVVFYGSSVNIYKVILDSPPSGFLVHSEECQIPDVNPYDLTVKQFVKTYETLNCSKQYPPLTHTVGNQLILDIHLLNGIQKAINNNVTCCYKPFYRPFETKNDNEIRYHKACVKFTDKIIIKEEFIMIECSLNKTIIYKNFHCFIHDKPKVEMRNAKIEKVIKKQNLYSVMIIGVDSVSRLNMHRQFPKTMDYLKNNMSAIEMFGYNKVGDNTFPNLVPLLSGFHEKELNFCRKGDSDVMDKCPLLWNKFQEFGYRTFYAEDTPHISTFNYLKPGFHKQPTDYYFRPFILAAEDAIGSNKSGNCHLCIGHISETEAILSWLEPFVKHFNNRPYFSFAWINSLTHDYLNHGSLGDIFYAKLFERLHSAGDLKNTIVIFMSDHGMRWGSIRDTYIGRLEERLPALLISFPPSFIKKYSNLVENVKINAFRLTTPFDLFATLKNILSIENDTLLMENWFVPSEMAPNYFKRALSLFNTIAKNRTCDEASIEEHWCTCQQSEKISVHDKEVIHIADYLITVLNNKLKIHTDCAKLVKDKITGARLRAPTKHLKASKEYDIFDYTVSVRTEPGSGVFEGTVRFVPKNHTHVLLGDISRLNLYGNQSYCIKNANLRKYCYCK